MIHAGVVRILEERGVRLKDHGAVPIQTVTIVSANGEVVTKFPFRAVGDTVEVAVCQQALYPPSLSRSHP